MPTTIIVTYPKTARGNKKIKCDGIQFQLDKTIEEKAKAKDKKVDRRCLDFPYDKTMKRRNEENDGKQAAEYQEHHDTYAMKIKENLITVTDLFYKYRRILIVKDIRKKHT